MGEKEEEGRKEMQTAIGILCGTLNINLESGRVSRRFIHVFVHSGKSFAVCQRFQIKGKESSGGEQRKWWKTGDEGHRNLVKSLQMPSFGMLTSRPTKAVKATLVELRTSG